MSGSRSNIAAGTQLAFYGIYDSSGVLKGSTTGTLAQGTAGSGMKQLVGIKRANPGPAQPEDVDITGDDTVLGSIEFGPSETPSFVIESAVFDLDIQAALQGTSVESLGDLRLGVAQPDNAVYPDICLIVQGKAKKFDAGVKGIKAWVGYIIPVCTVIPLDREEYSERTAGVNRYQVNTQVANQKPWGVTIADGDLGTTGAPLIPFTSDNPITMHTFIGDGATSDYGPVDKTPVSVGKIIIHEGNGQLLTATTDYTLATATITRVAGALGAATNWQVVYEFNP
jgi:hypothetical protein